VKSVADELGREDIARVLALSPEERIDLALRLGDEALETYATARAIARDEALRELRRNARKGRRYSRCIAELDEHPTR
jgi:hypothetical protein